MVDDGTCAGIGGCTDSRTDAYEPAATHDNGSCPPIILGCAQSAAENYRSLVTINDGTCQYTGCLDSRALNFNPSATSNALCTYSVPGCMNSNADNYNPGANVHTASQCMYLGCTDGLALNFEPNANANDGSCVAVFAGCTNPSASNYAHVGFNRDCGCCRFPGCADSALPNYNANAAFHVASMCAAGRRQLQASGSASCLDPVALNYDSLGVIHMNAVCSFPVFGCTESTNLYYVAGANTHNQSMCAPPTIYGCLAPTALNYQMNATIQRAGDCVYAFPGCVDPTAYNYNSEANVPNGLCTYPVFGCTIPIAANYNASATASDGSCTFHVVGCTNTTARNYAQDATVSSEQAVSLSMTQFTFAQLQMAACAYDTPGCTAPAAVNYNSLATLDDGSCFLYSPPPSPPPPGLPPSPPLYPPKAPPPAPSYPPFPPLSSDLTIVSFMSTVVKLDLTASGVVSDYDVTRIMAITDTLSTRLNCLRPTCVTTVRISAASVLLSITLTIPNGAVSSSATAAAVAAAANALVASNAGDISSFLGVNVLGTSAVTELIQVSVPLAVAPPPPPLSPPVAPKKDDFLIGLISALIAALVLLPVGVFVWRGPLLSRLARSRAGGGGSKIDPLKSAPKTAPSSSQQPPTANATVDGATTAFSTVESAMSAAVAATIATANLDDEIEDNLLVTDATKETHCAEGLSPELVATSEAVNVSTAAPQRRSISIATWMWETHRSEGLSPELVATSEAVNVSTATPQRGSISISPWMWGERTALDAHAFWERTALDGIGPTA